MRVLVADTFPEHHRHRLTELGHDCRYAPELSATELPHAVAGYDALVVRSTRVSAEVAAANPPLRLIVRAGAGTDTIDVHAAARAGITVCNVPGRNAAAVAELACGLLLAVDRELVDGTVDLREGKWDKRRYARATGILGRRVGILGLGAIGLAFAERVRAFGAEVYGLANARRPAATAARIDELGIALQSDARALAARTEVLSLHLPATSDTRHVVGRELLARMPGGGILLNTARSELVDEDALIEAMDERGIRAGIDVFAAEPAESSGTIESRLARHPNVYGSHHIGASTAQAQEAVADGVVHIVESFARGAAPHRVAGPEPAAEIPIEDAANQLVRAS